MLLKVLCKYSYYYYYDTSYLFPPQKPYFRSLFRLWTETNLVCANGWVVDLGEDGTCLTPPPSCLFCRYYCQSFLIKI